MVCSSMVAVCGPAAAVLGAARAGAGAGRGVADGRLHLPGAACAHLS